MGEVFAGRYELVDPIGRGGVGAVWRAWDHRRRRYVAAKVLQQRDAHSLLRFVREQALRIDHPHVLAPASWAADDDKVLFTMDLVAGGSLVHLVGDYGPLPPLFVCTLLDQLLSGLAAVHAEDVVHRDIKPANVLLEATGTGRPRLRLSDFGIAMRLGEPRLTETNLVVGTPGYLAPEQMMGAEPDFPADLFAVGLVALYLLEGARPDAKALIQYFAEHGTPGAPKGVPEPLWQVVATLLRPDPVARFRTATGARKALAAAVELLPEPGPDDEQIEVFDQLGPLPPGYGPDGPLKPGGGRRRAADPAKTSGAVPSEAGGDPGAADPWPGTHSMVSRASASASDTSRASKAPGATSNTSGAASNTSGAASSTSGAASNMPGASDVPADPRRHPAAPPPQPGGMSDTGSFHLPPPQPTVTNRNSPAGPARHHSPPEQQPQRQPPPRHDGPPPYPPPAQPSVLSPQPQAPLRPSPPPPGPVAPVMPQRADADSSGRVVPDRPPTGGEVSTASYTAQDPQPSQHPPHPREPQYPQGTQPPQAPHPPQGLHPSQSPQVPQTPPPRPSRHRRAVRRRPGPPAAVVVPLLLLALVCYAVGFWALAQG
ncbi:serine/threonine-protein kinase [Streptomyces cinereospinus]|uniref:non-specific serine/threonine protein kinase n=1 Tax=Streptomyces cinereospinus TaxID=285561 RepID=A0ABV5MT99_9ACTN